MTTVENLELIYTQFLNLLNEINTMINEEDYESAAVKMEQKTTLLNRLVQAKQTTNLTNAEDKKKIELIDNAIRENEKKLLSLLKENQSKIKVELDNTKKKVKINSAYSAEVKSKQGIFIDISE